MIVATTFIIGNSAKTAFESIIFLFVTHAYDVGDRVQIDVSLLFFSLFFHLKTGY